MRRRQISALAILVTLAILTQGRVLAQGSFPHDRFLPSDLAQQLAEVARIGQPTRSRNIIILSDFPKVRVKARYVGLKRPVTAFEKDLILRIAHQTDINPETYTGLFRNSYAFEAHGRRYWLPVEGPVADFFTKELTVGQEIELFAVIIGGVRDTDHDPELFALVEEFNTRLHPD